MVRIGVELILYLTIDEAYKSSFDLVVGISKALSRSLCKRYGLALSRDGRAAVAFRNSSFGVGFDHLYLSFF